jgi:hypothetical protein
MNKTTSDRFRICRRLVRDDAFEAQIAVHMAMPLLNAPGLDKLGDHDASGVLLRRALTRYIALVLCRLLERPEKGQIGETASIASLLDTANSERVLEQDRVQKFISDFDKVKRRRRTKNMTWFEHFGVCEPFNWPIGSFHGKNRRTTSGPVT